MTEESLDRAIEIRAEISKLFNHLEKVLAYDHCSLMLKSDCVLCNSFLPDRRDIVENYKKNVQEEIDNLQKELDSL